MNRIIILALIIGLITTGCAPVGTSVYTAPRKMDMRIAEMSANSLHTALIDAPKLQVLDVVQSPFTVKNLADQQVIVDGESSVVEIDDHYYFANAISIPEGTSQLEIYSTAVSDKEVAFIYLPVVNFYRGITPLTATTSVPDCLAQELLLHCTIRIPELADRLLITTNYGYDDRQSELLEEIGMFRLNSSQSNAAAYGAGLGVATVMGGALGGILAAGLMSGGSSENTSLSIAPGIGGVLNLQFLSHEE